MLTASVQAGGRSHMGLESPHQRAANIVLVRVCADTFLSRVLGREGPKPLLVVRLCLAA